MGPAPPYNPFLPPPNIPFLPLPPMLLRLKLRPPNAAASPCCSPATPEAAWLGLLATTPLLAMRASSCGVSLSKRLSTCREGGVHGGQAASCQLPLRLREPQQAAEHLEEGGGQMMHRRETSVKRRLEGGEEGQAGDAPPGESVKGRREWLHWGRTQRGVSGLIKHPEPPGSDLPRHCSLQA